MGHKTLHSTMLLLYRYPIRSGSCCKKLYIPLCFYYIGTSVRNPLSFSNLYIPLCFYYITRQQKGQQRYILSLHSTMLLLYPICLKIWRMSNTFTFHYASTISPPYRCNTLSNPCFTFHYASTISKADSAQKKASASFTFHYASTISGNPRFASASLLYLYIPLCFYYIRLAA